MVKCVRSINYIQSLKTIFEFVQRLPTIATRKSNLILTETQSSPIAISIP